MTKHYHVIVSLFGCMPSDNVMFRTRKEAIPELKYIVTSLRDSDNVVIGTLRSGYFEVTEKTDALCDYIAIEKCNMSECMEHDD